MSRENVELVKALQPSGVDLVEFFAGPVPESADVFADGCEVRFISAGPSVFQQLEYRGLGGLAQGWREWLEPWASFWIDVEEFIDAGDEVVALARVRGQTARDRVLVEHSRASVWTIQGGQVVRLRFYIDRDEAFRVSGLSEQDVHSPPPTES